MRAIDLGRSIRAQGSASALFGIATGKVVAAVVGVVAARGAESLREETDEENADGGHAGADDADVDLDGGPFGDLEIFPGWVLAVGAELDDGLETEDTDDGDAGSVRESVWVGGWDWREAWSLQGADAEHHTNSNLLLPVEVKLLKLRQGDGQHPDVEDDTDSSVGPGDDSDIKTFTLMHTIPFGPKVTDGLTLKDGDKDKDDAKYAVEDGRGPESPPHALAGEDAEVEEEQGQLE